MRRKVLAGMGRARREIRYHALACRRSAPHDLIADGGE